MKDLYLGTASFGMNYGITNKNGHVHEQEVKEMIGFAENSNINGLDTAAAYGNAEELIGEYTKNNDKLKISTKMQNQERHEFKNEDVRQWEQMFEGQLQRLKRNSLDTYMLHSVEELKKPGREILLDWLINIKRRGKIRRLGLSIYDISDLESVDLSLFDVIQGPSSIYDQRLGNDVFINIKNKYSLSFQARSIFLQGLILQPTSNWPKWISHECKDSHNRLWNFCKDQNINTVELTIKFVLDQDYIDEVVIGVCSIVELRELWAAWKNSSKSTPCNWKTWALSDDSLLDPRCWNKRHNEK